MPLYQRNDVIKQNWAIILFYLLIGTLVSLFIITGLAKFIGLSRVGVASMLSQSVTIAIALPLSTAVGVNAAVTAMACILNAVLIYALGESIC